MKVKTLQNEYKLIEFNFYITEVAPDSIVTIIEFSIDADENEFDFVEKDFSNIFAIETNKHAHVFSGYEVSEYYTEGDILHVVCTK